MGQTSQTKFQQMMLKKKLLYLCHSYWCIKPCRSHEQRRESVITNHEKPHYQFICRFIFTTKLGIKTWLINYMSMAFAYLMLVSLICQHATDKLQYRGLSQKMLCVPRTSRLGSQQVEWLTTLTVTWSQNLLMIHSMGQQYPLHNLLLMKTQALL